MPAVEAEVESKSHAGQASGLSETSVESAEPERWESGSCTWGRAIEGLGEQGGRFADCPLEALADSSRSHLIAGREESDNVLHRYAQELLVNGVPARRCD